MRANCVHRDVIPEPNSGCLLWLGHVNGKGYGQLRHKGRQYLAHRLAWELVNGPIPEGACLLHSCDVPSCVNTAHLRIGTRGDNAKYKVARQRQLRGEKHPAAKLTADQVRAIRADSRTPKEIAAEYGLHRNYVHMVLRGAVWGHV